VTRLIYGGPYDEVEVPAAGVVARRGEPVEIEDDAIAKQLLEQDIWTEEAPPTRRRKTDEEAEG
jgi:hypothetical protein